MRNRDCENTYCKEVIHFIFRRSWQGLLSIESTSLAILYIIYTRVLEPFWDRTVETVFKLTVETPGKVFVTFILEYVTKTKYPSTIRSSTRPLIDFWPHFYAIFRLITFYFVRVSIGKGPCHNLFVHQEAFWMTHASARNSLFRETICFGNMLQEMWIRNYKIFNGFRKIRLHLRCGH